MAGKTYADRLEKYDREKADIDEKIKALQADQADLNKKIEAVRSQRDKKTRAARTHRLATIGGKLDTVVYELVPLDHHPTAEHEKAAADIADSLIEMIHAVMYQPGYEELRRRYIEPVEKRRKVNGSLLCRDSVFWHEQPASDEKDRFYSGKTGWYAVIKSDARDGRTWVDGEVPAEQYTPACKRKGSDLMIGDLCVYLGESLTGDQTPIYQIVQIDQDGAKHIRKTRDWATISPI